MTKLKNECEVILKAIEVLDEQGWCRSVKVDRYSGAVCAIGALHGAIVGVGKKETGSYGYKRALTPDEKTLYNRAQRTLSRAAGSSGIIQWNDCMCKSKGDLQRLMRRAIEQKDKKP